MPEANFTSSLFEPEVFQQMVSSLEPARGLELYNSVQKDSTPYPMATWTQNKGSVSELAEYNVPNSKANLVDRGPSGSSERSASFAYIREADYFTPTATMLLKDVEQKQDKTALVPAEKLVAEQVATVNGRIDSRIEWSLWQALQGELNYSGKNTGTIKVDYGFQSTHKITLSTSDQWDQTPSLESLISTIRSTKQIIRKDSGVDVTEVYLTKATLDLLIDTWRKSAIAANASNAGILTDAQINEYYTTGEIKTNFMGIQSWKTIDQYYDERNADGQTFAVKSYLPHGRVIFGNRAANNALRYTSGPSMDFDAPRGHMGRFAKNWTEKDPSGYQFLIEEHGLPILTHPDQFARVDVASSTWVNAQTW